MYPTRSGLLFTFLLLAVTLAMVAPSHLASAQSETPVPTATPTPSWVVEVPLGTAGATLMLERRITYGEIAVVGTILLLLVGSIIFWIVRSVRL